MHDIAVCLSCICSCSLISFRRSGCSRLACVWSGVAGHVLQVAQSLFEAALALPIESVRSKLLQALLQRLPDDLPPAAFLTGLLAGSTEPVVCLSESCRISCGPHDASSPHTPHLDASSSHTILLQSHMYHPHAPPLHPASATRGSHHAAELLCFRSASHAAASLLPCLRHAVP